MTDAATLFTIHDIDVDDPMLNKSDVISHLMNNCCANHSTPTCAEISWRVESPVMMTISISKIVINEYFQGQLSSRDL